MSNATSPKSFTLWLFLIALSFIVTFWGFVTPLFEFPDEQVHLETVDYVARYGHVPGNFTPDVTLEMYKTQELLGTLRNDQGQNDYTYHPEYRLEYVNSLLGKYEDEIKSFNTPNNRLIKVKLEGARYPLAYYLYSSYWLKLVGSSDIITRSFAVRLGSLPLALFMAYFIYQTGMLLFHHSKLALTLTALTFLQPMFSFVTAGTNSDNLHNLLFFALVYYCLLLIKHGLSRQTLASLLIISVLDIYTKTQGYLTVPLIALAIFISVLRQRHWKTLVLLSILSTVFLLFTTEKWLGFLTSANNRGVSFIPFLNFSINKLISQNIVWYWGVFKWLGVVLPPLYWQLANRVVLLSAAGLGLYGWKILKKKKIIADPYITFYLLVSCIFYALAIYWADWVHHKNLGYSMGIQARYFFPTINAHIALLMTGILSLGWSSRIRLWLRRGLVFLFFWLQLGGLWRLLTSYYSLSSLPEFITQISQYKPFYLKGDWWYLWGIIYLVSLTYLLKKLLAVDSSRLDQLPQKPPSNKVV